MRWLITLHVACRKVGPESLSGQGRCARARFVRAELLGDILAAGTLPSKSSTSNDFWFIQRLRRDLTFLSGPHRAVNGHNAGEPTIMLTRDIFAGLGFHLIF